MFVAEGFEGVSDAFQKNFTSHGELGAACAVFHRGRCVVNLWGGKADPQSGRAWTESTMLPVFSVAKGVTALCVNRLIAAGQIDPSRPVADYWPEFGCNGKEAITVEQVMCHRAGLAAVDGDLTLEEVLAWDPVVEAIAAQAPNWEPGTAHGYHARSFGWILGELVRRVTGESIGRYLDRELARPLGLSCWIGLPAEQLERCARVIPPPGGSASIAAVLGADSLTVRVMYGPSGLFDYNEMWNRAEVLQAEMPSSNLVTDAHSIARLYAGILGAIDGPLLLPPEQLALATKVRSNGPDKVIFHHTAFGLGFSLQPMVQPGAGPNTFGHPGAGGSTAWADPDDELAFAYVTNGMRFDPSGDPRASGLVQATYEALAALPDRG
jgi:CubicO group peptidase (beta-lactamase class C family)